MRALYYGCYLGVILEGAYAAYVGDWFIVKAVLGALVVMFLMFGPPSYFLSRASGRSDGGAA